METVFHRVPSGKQSKEKGLAGDLEELNSAIRNYPWIVLSDLKGDPQLLRKIEETERLIKDLKKALSK